MKSGPRKWQGASEHIYRIDTENLEKSIPVYLGPSGSGAWLLSPGIIVGRQPYVRISEAAF